ncbi:MAG: hypothetical protein LBD70_00125, partial [Bifidobacteriaceae bacterium]|nr:hypothetical protein [Bifidobacteriaceae bacterium]
MFDPATGERAARRRLADPFLSAGDLAIIAGAFSSLAPLVAAHPSLYRALAQRLRTLQRADVNVILDARASELADDAAAPAPAPPVPSVWVPSVWVPSDRVRRRSVVPAPQPPATQPPAAQSEPNQPPWLTEPGPAGPPAPDLAPIDPA